MIDRLETSLRQNTWLREILQRFDEVALPDGWLVAGSIAQTIWNLALGRPAGFGIKDVDLVYFDAQNLSFEAEAENEQRLRDLFRHLPVKLDVKNEARVHLWYERSFGYPIAPYQSARAAIATFPTTATAVGVRCKAGKFECCSPFGLDDLFGLVVRPNKKQITQSIYVGKIERWRSIWPELKYIPWH
ncbi:MAG: nucleotidyltransferase family protein [Stellaceae bacterium]|jgi:uncharacterized protein